MMEPHGGSGRRRHDRRVVGHGFPDGVRDHRPWSNLVRRLCRLVVEKATRQGGGGRRIPLPPLDLAVHPVRGPRPWRGRRLRRLASNGVHRDYPISRGGEHPNRAELGHKPKERCSPESAPLSFTIFVYNLWRFNLHKL